MRHPIFLTLLQPKQSALINRQDLRRPVCTAALSLRVAERQSSSRLGIGKTFLSGKDGEKLDWIVQASGEALLLEIFKDKLDEPCPEITVADPALGQILCMQTIFWKHSFTSLQVIHLL